MFTTKHQKNKQYMRDIIVFNQYIFDGFQAKPIRSYKLFKARSKDQLKTGQSDQFYQLNTTGENSLVLI
jgi:hypothetical protein